MIIIEKRKLILEDPPTCNFLEKSIKAEREAIEDYMKESSRSDDMITKRTFHSIAIDEMTHLEILEDIRNKLGCK